MEYYFIVLCLFLLFSCEPERKSKTTKKQIKENLSKYTTNYFGVYKNKDLNFNIGEKNYVFIYKTEGYIEVYIGEGDHLDLSDFEEKGVLE